jgi:hypothetical protein
MTGSLPLIGRPLALAALLLAALPLAGCDTAAAPEPEPQPLVLEASPAPEWTALFDRTSGWTGADGIFSVPANGVKTPGTAHTTTTTFLFADTVIGEVTPSGRRAPGARIVNTTLATLRGGSPDPDRITFHWRTVGGQPRALVEPQTPEAGSGTWYWNQDGVVLGNTLHSLFLRLGPAPGAFPFEVVGVALVSFPVGEGLPTDIRQRDTPLFRPATPERGDIQFGAGILTNTVEAGAPRPDGYVYVYGVQNDPRKKLLVARVHPGDFEDFARWRFWDGEGWSPSLDAAAPLTDRISNELSVTPLTDGRYLLVFQLDALAPYVAVRIGESPVGPWGEVERVYRAPEAEGDPNTFVYNAKAHPHLSAPGELLVSYNVNTFDFFGAFFADASIYRPRFIRLTGLPR